MRASRRFLAYLSAGGLAMAMWVAPAGAHPHVFVEATMEIDATKDGHLQSLTNRWWMDELFSSSVIVDFDKNGNGKLDRDELAAIGEQVRGSIAQWSFYTFVHKDEATVAMEPPPRLDVTYDDKSSKLLFTFTMKPKQPLDLRHGIATFSNFDDTYFVAFDFSGEKNFIMKGLPPTCRRTMAVPSPDDAAKAWMQSISKLGTDDTVPMPADGIKFSEVLSTKFRVECKG